MKSPVVWCLAMTFGLLLPASRAGAEPPTKEKVEAALPGLESLAGEALKRSGVPGMAIAVVHEDRVALLKGFGVREAGKEGAVGPDTAFQLASVSKPIGATVVAGLVGDGKLGWDDRANDRGPVLRLSDPWVTGEVTIRDLLCHRSGLPEFGGDALIELGYGRAEVLRRLQFLKPSGGFRAHYAYSNLGLTAGAEAAARAAGMPWEDLCAERLYKPLGMGSTSSRFADFLAAKDRATPHTRAGEAWIPGSGFNDDVAAPAGGVSSTASDLARWVRLQLGRGTFEGRRVVAAGALAETHRPQVISGGPADPETGRAGFYGLGWAVRYDDRGRVRLDHSGAFTTGASTAVALRPADGLGIVVLTNGAPVGVAEAVVEGFFDLVDDGAMKEDRLAQSGKRMEAFLKGLGGGHRPDPEASPAPTPPLPLAAYVGSYANDLYGDLAVVEDGGNLALRLGPRPLVLPLKPRDRDVFIYKPLGDDNPATGGVTFTVGPDRRATGVTLDELDAQGQGTFRRRPGKG